MALPLKYADLLSHLSIFRANILKLRPQPTSRVKIGICVSGGPDSMALAYLVKGLADDRQQHGREQLGFELDPTAFIVDHKARPESSEEVKFVSEQLRKIGIPSQIIPMHWSQSNPLSLSNFETVARENRYRLLARRALQLKINHLFLGHHQDDQVETILSQLIRTTNPTFFSLRGMAEEGPVPACEDVYGARSDGSSALLNRVLESCEDRNRVRTARLGESHEDEPRTTLQTLKGRIQLLQPGGIRIYRPLLSFRKARLIATCEAAKIEYVKDKSNDDVTLTKRNTIRYLRSNYNLPKVLNAPSLLAISTRSRQRIENIKTRADQALREFKILSLDLRSGTMVIRIPLTFQSTAEKDPLVAASVVARLARTVSPMSRDNSPMLARLDASQNFFSCKSSPSEQDTRTHLPKTWHYGKTTFEPLNMLSHVPGEAAFWRLSRQSMRKQEILDATLMSSEDKENSNNVTASCESNYMLWDGRFWIRLYAPDAKLLSLTGIRPFRESDWAEIEKNASPEERKALSDLLRDAAPDKIRYSLPVLTLGEQIVAFPTSSTTVISHENFMSVAAAHGLQCPSLKWDVAWKVIDEPLHFSTLTDYDARTVSGYSLEHDPTRIQLLLGRSSEPGFHVLAEPASDQVNRGNQHESIDTPASIGLLSP